MAKVLKSELAGSLGPDAEEALIQLGFDERLSSLSGFAVDCGAAQAIGVGSLCSRRFGGLAGALPHG
jgi:hypothetical protein